MGKRYGGINEELTRREGFQAGSPRLNKSLSIGGLTQHGILKVLVSAQFTASAGSTSECLCSEWKKAKRRMSIKV